MGISELEQELRDGLARLYDPGFQPSPKLGELFGCNQPVDALTVQTKIVKGIENLKPASDVPALARTARFYEILHKRFVLRLTLEETALLLHMSVSSTWREQRAAIHCLTSDLVKQRDLRAELKAQSQEAKREKESPAAGPPSTAELSSEWLLQTKRELASLQSQAPYVSSNVGKLVSQVCELEKPLAEKRGVSLEIGQIKPDLEAAVHPNVLRQVLILTIGVFLRNMTKGTIALFGRMEDGAILVTLKGNLDLEGLDFNEALRNELVLPDDSSFEVYQEGRQVFVWIKLPPVIDRLNVLVLDDNLDMIHFFQRASEGTSYHIEAFTWGSNLFEAMQQSHPDIIILDVMLPGTDGWDLLMQLRANLNTRHIPVIVCSVVKGEELAYSLGAAYFLTKPVRPQEFVQALDHVLAQNP